MVPAKSCSLCTGNQRFDSEASFSFNSFGEKIIFNFTIGNATGILASDFIAIPSLRLALRQEFALVKKEEFDEDFPLDGLLGLGYCNSTCHTLAHTLYAANLIDRLAFAVYLSDNNVTLMQTNPPSNIMFGGADLSTYSLAKEFNYTPLAPNAENWTVAVQAVLADGENLNLACKRVTFSTERPAMFLSPMDYNFTRAAITSEGVCGIYKNGIVTCPCPSATRKYPALTLIFDTFEVVVDQSAYFFKSGDLCYILIAEYNGTDMILGTMFLKQFYIEYDYDNSRIGLARAIKGLIIPEASESIELQWWGWLLLAMLAVVFFICLGMVKNVVRKSRRNERQDHSENGQMLQMRNEGELL